MDTAAPNPSRTRSPATSPAGPGLALGLFLAAWYGQFFLALLPSWSDGSYYDYGFLVPPALALFYFLRWRTTDCDPSRVAGNLRSLESSPLAWVLLLCSILAITLLRLFEAADSGWRAPLYAHGAIVLGFAGFLHRKVFGPAAWNAFVPIAVLVILSIPLPTFVETSLIHGLTQQVTDSAAVAVRWLGIPVTISGETLLLDNLSLQVGEGCSGVRSFQSSLFAGFLLGELLRLSLPRRFTLLCGGIAIAFAANCLRVIYLVRHAAQHGEANLQELHDLSGTVSMSATFLLLLLAGFLLREKQP